jgi:hypothetical protein
MQDLSNFKFFRGREEYSFKENNPDFKFQEGDFSDLLSASPVNREIADWKSGAVRWNSLLRDTDLNEAAGAADANAWA